MNFPDKIKILLVDDDGEDFLLIRDIVRQMPGNRHELEWAPNCNEARVKMEKCSYDVCLIDYRLKETTGIDVIKTHANDLCKMPLILLTGLDDPDIDIAAMQAGASDYLVKSKLDPSQLERAIRYAIKHKQLQLDLMQTNAQLKEALNEIKNAQDRIIEQERFIALGKMARGITHDLNNTLVPILGLSDCILATPEILENKEELKEMLNTIRLAAIDARQILRRLREFYAPSSLENRLLDINKIVEQAITLARPAWDDEARLKGINIKMLSNLNHKIEVIGSETDLRTVFVNLILNAVEAMEKDGIIEISSDKKNGFCTVMVKDNGVGMSEEVRKQCFIPFFSTKDRKGSGLGLSTCYGIIKRHNGDIKIESEEGKGTTVFVILPISDKIEGNNELARTEVCSRSSSDHISRDKTDKASQLTVLIVEDNLSGIKVVEKCLKRLGHKAIATTNGNDALKVFKEQHIDLVITDRAMPEMSGDELAEKLRAIDKNNVPIFMLTGFGDIMHSTDEKPAHIDCVLGKPITLEELKKAIDTVVRKR